MSVNTNDSNRKPVQVIHAPMVTRLILKLAPFIFLIVALFQQNLPGIILCAVVNFFTLRYLPDYYEVFVDAIVVKTIFFRDKIFALENIREVKIIQVGRWREYSLQIRCTDKRITGIPCRNRDHADELVNLLVSLNKNIIVLNQQ